MLLHTLVYAPVQISRTETYYISTTKNIFKTFLIYLYFVSFFLLSLFHNKLRRHYEPFRKPKENLLGTKPVRG